MDYASIIPILQHIPLFSDLNEEDYKDVVDNITMMYYPAEYTVFSEGAKGEEMYFIKSGSVKVLKANESGGNEVLAKLQQFEFFGEMALFDDSPRNATVVTTEETEVLILNKAEFYQLVAKNARVSQALSKEYFVRAKENQEK